jgi:hypothetical protein
MQWLLTCMPESRGLPKNLIRKLEERLSQTETLLRGVLSLVSDAQLESIVNSLPSEPDVDIRHSVKLSDSENWRRYPFNNVRCIRAWEIETCNEGSRTITSDNRSAILSSKLDGHETCSGK